MIKVTYYVGTNDKDTLKPELYKRDFIKLFDEIFKDYTLVEAIGRFTNRNNETTEELSLIVTTFIESNDLKVTNEIVFNNVQVLENKLNQESILVEISKPKTMFL
nr:MAG TPA: Protein of unknown function (DUF3574) [Caudoviricetes sp.]